MMRIFRAGDRVEWNPTGDEWKPGTVERVVQRGLLIALDENDQTLLVSPEQLRQLRQINDAGDPVEWPTTAEAAT